MIGNKQNELLNFHINYADLAMCFGIPVSIAADNAVNTIDNVKSVISINKIEA